MSDEVQYTLVGKTVKVRGKEYTVGAEAYLVEDVLSPNYKFGIERVTVRDAQADPEGAVWIDRAHRTGEYVSYPEQCLASSLQDAYRMALADVLETRYNLRRKLTLCDELEDRLNRILSERLCLTERYCPNELEIAPEMGGGAER